MNHPATSDRLCNNIIYIYYTPNAKVCQFLFQIGSISWLLKNEYKHCEKRTPVSTERFIIKRGASYDIAIIIQNANFV